MVLNYKVLQTIIAMITGSKVIELFCMADDLASLIFNSEIFDAMMAKYTLNQPQSANLIICWWQRYNKDKSGIRLLP